MYLLKKNNKLLLSLILLICLSIPAIVWLFYPGFFQTDDGEWMIIRFSAFYEALKDGQFPIRFLGRLNHGYGYPVANFLYPGFMYLASPIHLIGINFIDTIKILFAMFMLSSSIFSFLWLRKIFNNLPAFIGALFYLYAPYHLFDLYSRGSIGEVMALAVVPFILWMIERKNILFLTLGVSLLIISHNTLAMLFLPIIVLYIIFFHMKSLKFNSSLIYQYASILVLALGLSAFYWIPAVIELSYTNFSNTQVSSVKEYFVNFNLVSYSSVAVLLMSSIILLKDWDKVSKRSVRWITLFFIIISSLSIILSLEISLPVWNIIPSSFIQFPFRLLSYLILGISFLAAYVVSSLRGRYRYLAVILLLVLLSLSSYKYIKPSNFLSNIDSFYSTNEATTTVKDEYMPVWVKTKPIERYKNKVEIIQGRGEINNLYYNNSKKVIFDYSSDTDSKVRINTIYYPGWKIYVDGVEGSIDYSNEKGLIETNVGKGNHKIELIFSETPIRIFADLLSIISVFAILIFAKYSKNN
ncbi:hypothetical protein C4577_05975 [Candidatus Parcubacteria bacterium]|nr:MAG: hypothetical protein C4577_05975 [Candidatus Parcubacteria bacterium]